MKDMRDKFGKFIKGHIVPEEFRRKVSLATKKRAGYWKNKKRPPFSKKWRENMSKAFKGRKHSEKTKQKLSKNRMGSNNPNWKGRIKHPAGYIKILQPTHQFCDSYGYVMQHRLIVEQQIGRPLTPIEKVHHINGIKDDNRPENLMAFRTESLHKRFEKGHCLSPSDIVFDGRSVRM